MALILCTTPPPCAQCSRRIRCMHPDHPCIRIVCGALHCWYALHQRQGKHANGYSEEITERPRDPSGVAAFMSANGKTPYITPSMDFPSRNGVVWGRRGPQLEFSLVLAKEQNLDAVPSSCGPLLCHPLCTGCNRT